MFPHPNDICSFHFVHEATCKRQVTVFYFWYFQHGDNIIQCKKWGHITKNSGPNWNWLCPPGSIVHGLPRKLLMINLIHFWFLVYFYIFLGTLHVPLWRWKEEDHDFWDYPAYTVTSRTHSFCSKFKTNIFSI
jgi:hypothetical protein